MSDDQIRAYLRSRAQGQPPPDLADAISRAADATPQQRRSWFAPFAPAAIGLGLTAVVIVAAILVGQDPIVGPGSSESPSPVSTPDASVVSRPSPTPAESIDAAEGDLTQAGTQLTIPAQDAAGSWGSISIERLPDAGGLRTVVTAEIDEANPDPSTLYFVNDPDMFYLEISIDYEADREPDPLRFGADDWVLQGAAQTIASMDEKFFAMSRDFGPAFAADLPDPEFFGTLTFAVPRSLADVELRLEYQPASHDAPAWVGLVRTPGAPPESFVMAPPGPMTAEQAAIAEALFATPDTCTNPVAGYTVTFPDDWYTNTAIGSWPACSWFSPVFYEVDDPDVIPDEVAIVINYEPVVEAIGMPSLALRYEQIEVDGRPAYRAEYVGVGGGFMDIGSFAYGYVVGMDGDLPGEGDPGPILGATASWAVEDDPQAYRLATAILDRIMASLVFDD
jgi:hypothetical protein